MQRTLHADARRVGVRAASRHAAATVHTLCLYILILDSFASYFVRSLSSL